MIFEKIPTVLTADELIDKAFSRASRAGRGKNDKRSAERSMITTASNILSDNLKNIVRKYPNLDELPEFYLELTDILVGIDPMKKSLSSIDWAGKKIRGISKRYLSDMGDQDPVIIRKRAYGRMASIVGEVDTDLKFLNEARDKLKKIPTIVDLPTIVVIGYPNVGKSSFISVVSSGKPKIDSYPFTTKGISVGHFFLDKNRYQIIDTPGLFDRPLSKRNANELQAILALRHLSDVILFILDPTETCGYIMSEQMGLLSEVKREFDLPILVVSNKIDLAQIDAGLDMSMSALTGENVSDVLSRLIEMIPTSLETKAKSF
ncbi:MAG: GTPase [Halobacteriota archaeon]|nr:GTPase [Halobacteriota archaeon]